MDRISNIKNRDKNITQEYIFVPYKGENRCNRCIFAYNRMCSEMDCTPEERSDKKIGFFRARYDIKHEQKFNNSQI